jgi:hypothetical protein
MVGGDYGKGWQSAVLLKLERPSSCSRYRGLRTARAALHCCEFLKTVNRYWSNSANQAGDRRSQLLQLCRQSGSNSASDDRNRSQDGTGTAVAPSLQFSAGIHGSTELKLRQQ